MDLSLFEHDAGYYEFVPGKWLPGKPPPGGFRNWGPDVVAKAVAVEFEDSDVLIATYPKTGTTWTMVIIRLILQSRDLEDGKDPSVADFYKTMPFLEIVFPDGTTGADHCNSQSSPRYIKTHLPHEMWVGHLEKHPNIKVIQTLRNPKDSLISYYHHFTADLSMGGFNGTWDQFFEIVKAKKLPWGDFFEVNVEWYKFNKDRENSLVLRYEDIKKDTKGEIDKIAKFIGYDLSERALQLVMKHSVLGGVSQNLNKAPDWRTEKSTFIRKGSVGGWRDYFSPEQSEWVDARTREILEPLGITFEY